MCSPVLRNALFLVYLILYVTTVLITFLGLLNNEWSTFYLNPFGGLQCVTDLRFAVEHISKCSSVSVPPIRDRYRSYDVSLCLTVVNYFTTVPKATVMKSMILDSEDDSNDLYNDLDDQKIAYENLQQYQKNNWKVSLDVAVFKLYPQSAPIKNIVARIKKGCEAYQAPINNQKLRLLTVSHSICPPIYPPERLPPHKRYDLIVVVKSAVYNFQWRSLLRKAYATLRRRAHFRVAIVFSVGLPRRKGGNFFYRDGFNVTLPDRAGKALLENEGAFDRIRQQADAEASQFDDMIIGDYEDTYFNLTTKMMITYQWVRLFCRDVSPTFLLMDDDYGFNFTGFKELLLNLPLYNRKTLLLGKVKCSSEPARPIERGNFSKWSLSWSEFPFQRTPCHPLGFFYVVGHDRVEDLVLAMFYTKPLVIDDIFLGLSLTKLGWHFKHLKGAFLALPKRKDSTPTNIMIAPLKQLLTLPNGWSGN